MSSAHLLVVEDHLATARALKQYLEIMGYTVTLAGTVAEAVIAAGARAYDLLLCDLNLPDGTGWDLLEILKRGGAVRAIAFSAFDDAHHIAHSRSAGFLDHIAKGTNPGELVRRIERARKTPLEEERPRREAAPRANRPPTDRKRAEGID